MVTNAKPMRAKVHVDNETEKNRRSRYASELGSLHVA